ncbi:unnamed protein product, partial [Brenthis ino]
MSWYGTLGSRVWLVRDGFDTFAQRWACDYTTSGRRRLQDTQVQAAISTDKTRWNDVAGTCCLLRICIVAPVCAPCVDAVSPRSVLRCTRVSAFASSQSKIKNHTKPNQENVKSAQKHNPQTNFHRKLCKNGAAMLKDL